MSKYEEMYSQNIGELENIKKRLLDEHLELENILNREVDIEFVN